jgi:branched-chain amino acid transport system substrate-binding protein
MKMGVRLLLAALVLLTLAACDTRSPITIGVVLSSEGQEGAQLAVDELNESGGINGRPVALRVMGGGASALAGPALAAAESLSADRSVVAVVGHSNSSASLSASQIYNARRLVHIAPTSSSPMLTTAGPYTFRMVGSDIHQARFLADAVMSEPGPHRIAAIYVNDDYGHALHREVRSELASHGIAPVYQAPYAEHREIGHPAEMIAAMVAAGATHLLWLGRSPQLIAIMGGLRGELPGLRVIASDGTQNATALANRDSALTGVRVVSFLSSDTTSANIAMVRARYRATSNQPFTAEIALAYDAVHLIAMAVRAKGTDRERIREYLAGVGTEHSAHRGASGDIGFDVNGDPRTSYHLAEISAP